MYVASSRAARSRAWTSVPEGTPGAAVISIRKVDELGFYNLGALLPALPARHARFRALGLPLPGHGRALRVLGPNDLVLAANDLVLGRALLVLDLDLRAHVLPAGANAVSLRASGLPVRANDPSLRGLAPALRSLVVGIPRFHRPRPGLRPRLPLRPAASGRAGRRRPPRAALRPVPGGRPPRAPGRPPVQPGVPPG